jgi:hypothetical protein
MPASENLHITGLMHRSNVAFSKGAGAGTMVHANDPCFNAQRALALRILSQ